MENNAKKNKDLFGNEIITDVLLRDKFLEPPFSVLDTKQGHWQNRKRAWHKLGIRSETSREAVVNKGVKNRAQDYKYEGGQSCYGGIAGGISIFDPALTELMYRWFCPSGGLILDPFAGGSVRGIVANYLGFKYTGFELRQEQVDSNREQAIEILPVNNQPQWYCGDSEKLLDECWLTAFDFIFSCPPYVDLEVYSDMPDDLSNMNYENFTQKYFSIIGKSLKLLKPGGYAVFVVGEVRDKQGFYYDFVGDTKRAFMQHGAKFYNDVVLLNSIGSAMLRCAKIFEAGKKLTKVHQNVLVFKKL